MFDYLQQFNNLPKNLRDQVSSPSAMALLTELENKYKLDLAMVVMKVMIRNITVSGLPSYFASADGLSREAAADLTRELKEKIFIGVADYLGITSDIRALDLDKDIKIIIAEAGLTISSQELINRFKSILSTYLRGVRAKIDTRAALGKEVIAGGLNLSPAEIDRVFKVCETQKFKSLNISLSPSPVNFAPDNRPTIAPSNQLNKIINNSDGKLAAAGKIADYNLKDMIARGQVKKPQLDLPLQEKQLDLPPGETVLKLEKELKIDEPVKINEPLNPINPVKAEGQVKKIEPVKIIEPAKIIPPVKVIPPIQKTAPASPASSAPKIITPIQKAVPITPIIPPHPGQARPALTPAQTSSRPVMHDIKPMPKVMGPIEELQFLDVVNFRRLGATPVEAVTKIFNKIKLLEKEGYDKMIQGIKAWRQSPVNRLYIKIGQEAISAGVTIKEAALARQKNNPEYLKIEEIEALVGLNSKLVF